MYTAESIHSEHVQLVLWLKENLPFTPFVLDIDDYDFLMGAIDCACAELKIEPIYYLAHKISDDLWEVYNVDHETEQYN